MLNRTLIVVATLSAITILSGNAARGQNWQGFPPGWRGAARDIDYDRSDRSRSQTDHRSRDSHDATSWLDRSDRSRSATDHRYGPRDVDTDASWDHRSRSRDSHDDRSRDSHADHSWRGPRDIRGSYNYRGGDYHYHEGDRVYAPRESHTIHFPEQVAVPQVTLVVHTEEPKPEPKPAPEPEPVVTCKPAKVEFGPCREVVLKLCARTRHVLMWYNESWVAFAAVHEERASMVTYAEARYTVKVGYVGRTLSQIRFNSPYHTKGIYYRRVR